MRNLAAIGALILVAGCSGGGGGGGDDDRVTASGDSAPGDPSFATGTQSTADLSFTGFEGDGTLRGGESVSVVNLATGVVTGGEFAGTINPQRTQIALAGGGTVTLTDPGATEYVRLFRREAAGSDPVFGVVGFLSSPSDLPGSGRVSYTGAADVLAADATRIYTLDGTAFVVADFGSDEVRIELRDLGGEAQGVSAGNTGTVTIPRGGRVIVDGSRISGAGFSGGAASVSGLPFSITGTASASGTNGGFFGPGADEVAGRVVVDDPQGDVRVLGTFAAD
ncbi:MAG: transferrin-binding protein-like solute binding protein [Rhodobacteraceae bacterium]|jgi:hypothetical protein|nr:transferrin-binding protein-like solute binding protein [Paracoccaceae bacterium]